MKCCIMYWTPLGVKDEPYARTEYRSYMGSILGLLENNKTFVEIAEYLCRIESEYM